MLVQKTIFLTENGTKLYTVNMQTTNKAKQKLGAVAKQKQCPLTIYSKVFFYTPQFTFIFKSFTCCLMQQG